MWLLVISPLIITAQLTSKKTNPKYLLIFIIYFLTDSALQSFGQKFFELEFLGLNWNWSGKTLSLILSLIFILSHSKEIRKDIGFTSEFRNTTIKFGILVFLGFLLFDFVFKMILFPKGKEFALETFLFQATMPGLAEELVYRGIFLWLLGKAFVSSRIIKGVSFGWDFIIVTFMFAMIHGIYWTESFEIKVDFETIIYLTFITSLSIGILRKFSGNVILPIIGHNIVNVMNAIIRIL